MYRRYARPEPLIDEAITNGALFEFVSDVWRTIYEEKNERQLWELWLHKDYENSYSDFRKKFGSPSREVEVPQQNDVEVASTITNSRNILEMINPSN